MRAFAPGERDDHECAHAVMVVAVGGVLHSVTTERMKLPGDEEGVVHWSFAPDDERSTEELAQARAMVALAPQVFALRHLDINLAHFADDDRQVKIAHAMVGNRPGAVDEWRAATFIRLNEKPTQRAIKEFGRELSERRTIDGPEAETFIQGRLDGWIPEDFLMDYATISRR